MKKIICFNYILIIQLLTNECSCQISFGSVVISEFLSDPSPDIGLGSEEYIELYNRESFPIDLSELFFSDSKISVALEGELEPFSYRVVYKSDLDRWPSLNNDYDILSLLHDSILVYEVAYNLDSLPSDFESEGGVSFEMVNLNELEASFKENFRYSTVTTGGTPGAINSVNFSRILDTHDIKYSVERNILTFDISVAEEGLFYGRLYSGSLNFLKDFGDPVRVFGHQLISYDLNPYKSENPTLLVVHYQFQNQKGDIDKNNICIVLE